jgi:bis(5'-nucleosyl)-tetraphosphatase (symmetrical)
MPTYAIGDLQGCHDQLQELLTKIDAASPQADLLFAGDLINRGSKSLKTLRLVKSLCEQGRARTVLGNHDLHLIAVANGIRPAHRSDTIAEILQAPDRDELINWLRHQPLAIHIKVDQQDHLLVHAGVLPQWTLDQARSLAGEVESVLRADNYADFLRQMYGNSPAQWRNDLQGADRLRCIINALTRMRLCSADGVMEFESKEGIGDAPHGYQPWFDAPARATANDTVIFGHWSTLGLVLRENLISLDTGCVWGGKLTAVCLDNRQVIQIDCPQQQKPGRL